MMINGIEIKKSNFKIPFVRRNLTEAEDLILQSLMTNSKGARAIHRELGKKGGAHTTIIRRLREMVLIGWVLNRKSPGRYGVYYLPEEIRKYYE